MERAQARAVGWAGIAGLVAVLLSGTALAADYHEAPVLAARVAAGTLPPVAQRLPEMPLVVQPVEHVGHYGGTWRMAVQGGSDSLVERTLGYTRLVRWKPDWSDVTPDLAESYTVSPDARDYVFKLRRGLKWSDGQPFTVDDLMFWYQDVLMNKELTPAIPAWLGTGDHPLTVEKIDDITVRFAFAQPNGMFLKNLATVLGSDMLAAPRHWLQQFHKKYNPDGVAKLVAAAGAPDWVNLFNGKIGPSTTANRWRSLGRPVLNPWMLTVPYVGTTQVVAERNPYFFKVDPAGNQLPYIDRVTFDVVGDSQALVLKAVNGEIDMQSQGLGSIDARSTLVDNQKVGGYHLFKAIPAYSNALLINLNETDKAPALRQFLANHDVRAALSQAINRDELNELIFAGQAQPYQAAPRPGTALYDETLAKQYTQFDPDAANALLDKAGYAKKDADGFRLGSDGKRLSITIDTSTTRKYQVDALEMIKDYWRTVGVEMQARVVQDSLIFARLQANDEDGVVWIGGGGYDQLGLLDPKWYFPHEFQSSFATAWGIYYQDPKDPHAEPPSAPALKQMKLYDQLLERSSTADQLAVMKQILAITRDQFYVIGTNMAPDNYGIVSNRLHNVPAEMPDTLFYVTPGPTNPEQYYFD